MDIKKFIGKINITDNLDEDVLGKIGSDCSADFKDDQTDRTEKDFNLEKAKKIAQQVIEPKTFPKQLGLIIDL